MDYVLDINAYDVKNADALVQQTEKIQEHGSNHAHEISHVSFISIVELKRIYWVTFITL